MNYEKAMSTIYDFVMSVLKFGDQLWKFLNEPIKIPPHINELDGLAGTLFNGIIRWINTLGWEFTPIALFGGTMLLTLMLFFLIKSFVPVA